jgi:hypothetical protein
LYLFSFDAHDSHRFGLLIEFQHIPFIDLQSFVYVFCSFFDLFCLWALKFCLLLFLVWWSDFLFYPIPLSFLFPF